MNRIHVNEEVCFGCGLCEVYCQLNRSKSKDLLKAFKKESPRPVAGMRIERAAPVSFAVQCRQCPEPYCVYSCLTGAISRDPDSGIVNVDAEKCIGCWTCILSCPFGAIRQDTGRGKIAKCDLCQGEDIPACVANCPNEALTYTETQERVLT